MVRMKQKPFRKKQETAQEEREIGQLKELLPKISGECRAYIKGAAQALLYAQEEPEEMAVSSKRGILA